MKPISDIRIFSSKELNIDGNSHPPYIDNRIANIVVQRIAMKLREKNFSFCWGFDPEDKGAARVFFFEDLNGFIQFDIPKDLNEEYIIPELGVRFDTVESYPLFEEFDVLNNTEYDWDEYDSVLAELGVDVEEDFEEHKILG